MAASSDAVATAAVIAVVAAVIGFLGFQLLRSWSRSAILYDSKRHTPAVKHKPSALPNTCFGWVWATISYAESLDTAIYLRLMSFGTTLFSILTVWCIITILPTNWTDSEVEILLSKTTEASSTSNYEFSGFDKLALTNVQPGSHRLWVHLISVYVVTCVTLKLLWKNSCDCVLLRLMWIGSQRPTPITHSVLVTDIPGVSDATRRTRTEWQRKQRNAKHAERESMRAGRPLRTTEEAAEEGLVYYTPSLSTSSTQQIMANAPPMSDLPIHSLEGPNDGPGNGPATHNREPIKRAASHNAFLPPNFIQSEELRRLHRKQLQRFDLSDASLLDPVAVAKGALGPGHMDPQDFVHQEFSSVYSEEELRAINLVHDLSDLQPLYAEYNKLTEKLGDYIDECRHKQARGRAMKRRKVLLCLPLYGNWALRMYGSSTFKRVDMLGFYLARLREVERAILEEQGRVKTLVWPSAFVTFSSRVSQTVAATSLHHHDERTWRVQPAPPPDELVRTHSAFHTFL
ncbi:late exocytosis, associated with Golgi transport-domain-containing protein [Dunaliella salina]|uniref:Late exocytosis, associated with Golgi transport-domain-containing protein n=1 Tax=Dunaliella salina TaxID=3046 RepID=A0ABQ7GMI7_DUNSA|nr:late exocytosis, associated with Golgi transport-domain-containing protein [Dunaliella salina]|eukprot:KAF5835826.1 late exocytosis, associated with Golgi transport-domain-containing protein [Dunaliella salina]